jgi:hypothetical protein
LQNGSYALLLTQNSCIDTSNCHVVIISGIHSIPKEEGAYLYPNPSPDIFYFVFSNSTDIMPYAVYDIAGREILAGVLTPTKNLLDLSAFADGVYFLKSGNRLFKLFKN